MFCWFFRFMISNAADGDGGLSGGTERHIRRCANCREFYEACLSLGEGLRREGAVVNDEFSRRLSERVLAAVPGRRANTYKLTFKWRPIVVAACVAVIASMGVLFLTRRENGPDSNQYENGREIIYSLVGEDFLETWPKLVEGPLPGEIENLAADTESAVRFLVACVAVDPTQTKNELPN
ncbi:MAG: hypothetical protein KAY65_07925 [Planctomycetes bacterium]|nr:hypothetical protein [Planctomycetota bacterium]